MTDIVNQYFRQFYPTKEELDAANVVFGSVGFSIEVPGKSNIFPAIVMADGLCLSAQGHHGAYCYPRDDFADEYAMVEIMGPRDADALLLPFQRDCNVVGTAMIYPFVPVGIVEQVIIRHGGFATVARDTARA